MEKIDIHGSKENFTTALASAKKSLSKENYALIKRYLEASAIGRASRKGANKKTVSANARVKNLFLLKVVASYFKKSIIKVTLKDMEKLIRDLQENKIHKLNGNPYSEETKSQLKKTYIQFLRFSLGENERFSKLTSWVETSYKKKEVQILSEAEVLKMLDYCHNLQQQFLVAVLFDSGCRIEEFLNIRFEDVQKVAGDYPYYKITVREEFSKTKGRVISLLWPQTTQIIDKWLAFLGEHNPEDPVFDSCYDASRISLARIGKRALKKRVYPHLLRRSSATYYASKRLTYSQLCRRYGWAVGSQVPSVYIDKSGVEEEKVIKEFRSDNLDDLRAQLQRLEDNNKQLRSNIEEITESLGVYKVLEKHGLVAQKITKLSDVKHPLGRGK